MLCIQNGVVIGQYQIDTRNVAYLSPIIFLAYPEAA